MINKSEIIEFMMVNGFRRAPYPMDCYVLSLDYDVCGTYLPHIINRQGFFRFGGSVGLWCQDFESNWQNRIKKIERKFNRTVPFVINIGNFHDLSCTEINNYHSTFNNAVSSLDEIKKLVESFPKNMIDLKNIFRKSNFRNISIVDFLMIDEFRDLKELYMLKSVHFLSYLCSVDRDYVEIILSLFSKEKLKVISRISEQENLEIRHWLCPL